MDDDPVEQVVNELFPYFEALEARSAAILQFLKDKGLTTDEQFAPYLEQAGNGSNVKWLAARIRVQRLLSSKVKPEKDKDLAKEEEAKNRPASAEQTTEASAEQDAEHNSEHNAEETSKQSAQQNKEEEVGSKGPEPDANKTDEKPAKHASQNTADANRNSKDSGARSQADIVPKKSE